MRDASHLAFFLTITNTDELRRYMTTITTFAELSIQPEMMRAIEEMGFKETTPVQAQTIPLTRTGVDILAQSQTGTGKTMAFAIPAVERIDADIKSIQVLVLSPTRELAQQCGDEIRKLIPYMPHVQTADIYGGSDYKTQFRDLRKANLVIGTPGRIMDHMKRGTLKLDKLEMIVLDEADEMLNMGFKEDIETILEDAPEERQIVLFSATVPKGILDITKQFQNNPVQINLVQDKATLKEIKQLYVDVPKHQKEAALKLLMHYHKPQRSIVFANTKSMVDELTEVLCSAGLLAQGIHGDMKQQQRTAVMTGFKTGKIEILVATDVAARGIDVSDVDYVFNFDIPRMTEYYVHRIGRTGRAGRSGTAITLCCGRQQIATMRMLAKKLQSTIDEAPMPTVASIKTNQIERNVKRVQLAIEEQKAAPQHKQMVDMLISQGHSAEDIAAALMSIAFEHSVKGLVDLPQSKSSRKEKSRNEHSSDRHERDRGDREHRDRDHGKKFGNMAVNIGASSRCSANHLVGAITEYSGISSKVLGKIKIEENHSIIAVEYDYLYDTVEALRNVKICGKPVTATVVTEDKQRAGRDSRDGNFHKRGSGSKSHSKSGSKTAHKPRMKYAKRQKNKS